MGAMLDRCFTEVIFMGSFDIHDFVVIGRGKPPTNVYTLSVNDMCFNSMHVCVIKGYEAQWHEIHLFGIPKNHSF